MNIDSRQHNLRAKTVTRRRPVLGQCFVIALFATVAVTTFAEKPAPIHTGSDSASVGLWLFDEFTYPHTTLTDASESAKADLCLMGGGSMVAGKFGNALRISGPDYAVCYAGFAGKVPQEEMRVDDGIPSGLWGPTEGPGALLRGLAAAEWTVEFWLQPTSLGERCTIIDLGQGHDPGFSFNLVADGFEVANHYAGVKAFCAATLSAGKWQHVAITRNGSRVACFIDGVKQGLCDVASIDARAIPDLQIPDDREHGSRGFEDMTTAERQLNRFNLALGSDRQGNHAIACLIDELRVSKVTRYGDNFTPASFSKNYGTVVRQAGVANGPSLLFDPKPVSIPLDLGSRKHLFIDDAILEKKEHVQIVMNQPFGKRQLQLDFRIEKSAWRPSVFDVDDEIFMAIPESYSSNKGLTVLATSRDGISFQKRGTIIPETPMYGAFFKDLNPNLPADELYKVNAFVANRGMYFYTSPDGLNWRRNETIQLPLVSGGGGECYWDDQRGIYVSFIKRDSSFRTKEFPGKGPKGHKAVMFETKEIIKPWPFIPVEKPWYEGWPFPSVTGEGDTIFVAQDYGWVYRTRAIKYPWAPDVYLAFIWRYPGDDGARHVELAVSRNGRDWKLFGPNWYIPTGDAEEEIVMYGLLRRGSEIWQYVNEGAAHGGSGARTWSRYQQRLDGFVSLDAGDATGTAMTLPLRFDGDRLVLNLAVDGWLKVALADHTGEELPGFGTSDCDPIRADATRHVVTWNGSSDLSEFAGKVIRIHFQLQDAKLFAMQFTGDSTE